MSYDKDGLGFMELAYLSLNHSEVFDTVVEAIYDDNETVALDIARKYIKLIGE